MDTFLNCCGFRGGDLDADGQTCFRFDEESDPVKAKACLALGCAFQEQKSYEKAVVYYKECLKLDPSCSDAHYNIATILQETNKIEESIRFYKRFF